MSRSYPSTSRPFSTPSSRWSALTTRDPKADTHFVYGVRTTKCYCRPICPARLARRANIEFFDTPAEAIAAGFRACKRCKPETVAEFQTIDDQSIKRKEGIQRAVAMMQAKNGVVSLEDAAKTAGIGSKWHFLRVFKEVMGETPGAMMARIRLQATSAITSPVIPENQPELDDAQSPASGDTVTEASLSPLETAWITTDPGALDQLFSDIFPSDPFFLLQDDIDMLQTIPLSTDDPPALLNATSTDPFDFNKADYLGGMVDLLPGFDLDDPPRQTEYSTPDTDSMCGFGTVSPLQ